MKLSLTFENGTLAGRSFELSSGFLTIGRGENCSVRFDPARERIASKQHAFIESTPDGFILTDNKSTNGTSVNGNRVEKTKLSNGDQIQFGQNGMLCRVTLIEDAAPVYDASVRDLELQQYDQIANSQEVSLQNSVSSIGLGNLATPLSTTEAPGRGKRYIVTTIVIMAIVFLSLIVIVLTTSALSPVGEGGGMTINIYGLIFAVIASVIAFVPAVFYVLPLIWIDRYDPEPLWLLALAFAWGALVAVIFSFVINTGIGVVAYLLTRDPMAAEAISGVISAPIFEEASKGTGLLILLIFFRRYFDDILDGIVFAGVIALGFATVENVLYYGRGVGTMNAGAVIALFVLRGILSPFAHVTFTAMTGIGCGISRESHNKFVRILMPMLGYAAAVGLHALWNGMAFLGGLAGFVSGYILLEVPFFILFVGFTSYIMYRQNRILKEMLAIDVARGLIPQEHAAKATSAFRSSGWLLGGITSGKFKARSNYMRAIGNLGLSYWHIQRATAAQGQTGSFQQNPILREEVLKWRDQV